MARPRQFAPAKVEQGMLDVFWSRGYTRTSIEDLTRATGLLRGSLYAAYGSKEEMFRTAMRRYVAELSSALLTGETGLDAIERVLDTVVRLTVDDPKRRGCLVVNAVAEADGLGTETTAMLEGGLTAMQALLRTHLREAQAAAGTDLDLEPLVAMLYAAGVAIRVLGRAGQRTRLLHNVARGAVMAVRRSFDTKEG